MLRVSLFSDNFVHCVNKLSMEWDEDLDFSSVYVSLYIEQLLYFLFRRDTNSDEISRDRFG